MLFFWGTYRSFLFFALLKKKKLIHVNITYCYNTTQATEPLGHYLGFGNIFTVILTNVYKSQVLLFYCIKCFPQYLCFWSLEGNKAPEIIVNLTCRCIVKHFTLCIY